MGISHKREIVIKRGRNRAKRPKTFKTEEGAKKHAETLKLKKFTVVVAGKKFKVVSE